MFQKFKETTVTCAAVLSFAVFTYSAGSAILSGIDSHIASVATSVVPPEVSSSGVSDALVQGVKKLLGR